MNTETNIRQLESDAAFFYSFSLAKMLLDEELITKREYSEIVKSCKTAFGTNLI